MQSGSYQTCDVCHIDKQNRAHFVSDLAELLEIDRARIRRCTCNDHLGLALFGNRHDIIIVDHALIIDTIRNDIEIGA